MTPDQKNLFDKLTKLQQRMAINVLAGMTQTQSHIEAGGVSKNEESARASASEIFANPNVRAFMDAMQQAAVSAAVMTRTEAMERLSDLARASIADMAEFGEFQVGQTEDGEPVMQAAWKFKPSALQDKRKMAAISELATSKEGIKMKIFSPLDAIKQLVAMEGWTAAQKLDLSSSDGSMTPSPGVTIDAALVKSVISKINDEI